MTKSKAKSIAHYEALLERHPRPFPDGPKVLTARRHLCSRFLRCVRRRRKRVTFCDVAEVTEYSRTFGHHRVPTDGGELAIGLGRPICTRFAPLQEPPAVSNLVRYFDEEGRAKLLKDSMEPGHFLKAAIRHCRQNAQVLRWRKEAVEDKKVPRTDMPYSYAEAIEQALEVSAEVQTATAETISLLPSGVPLVRPMLKAKKPVPMRCCLPAKTRSGRLVCRKQPLSSADIRRAYKVVCLLRDAAP